VSAQPVPEQRLPEQQLEPGRVLELERQLVQVLEPAQPQGPVWLAQESLRLHHRRPRR
jgi:hypothetical protein